MDLNLCHAMPFVSLHSLDASEEFAGVLLQYEGCASSCGKRASVVTQWLAQAHFTHVYTHVHTSQTCRHAYTIAHTQLHSYA
jgi:FPC/CPF motif-containing protein YcgG